MLHFILTLTTFILLACNADDALYQESDLQDRKLNSEVKLRSAEDSMIVADSTLEISPAYFESHYSINSFTTYRFETTLCCINNRKLTGDDIATQGIDFVWVFENNASSFTQVISQSYDNTETNRSLTLLLIDSLQDTLTTEIHLDIDTSFRPEVDTVFLEFN